MAQGSHTAWARLRHAGGLDQGRLIGEDVWEPEPSKAELLKLDPTDVLTTEESAKLLAPFIKPLLSFDEMVLGKKSATRASAA